MRKSLYATLPILLIALPGGLAAQPRIVPAPAELLRSFEAAYAPAREVIEQLAAQGEASRFRSPGAAEWLAGGAVRRAVAAAESGLEPTLEAETVVLHALPAEARSRGDLGLVLYNTLRSISAMKGVEYWSPSRKRMRVMFNDAYVVDPGDRERRLPDPMVAAAPARDSLYVFQDDSSFGRNVYEAVFTAEAGTVQVGMRNLTNLVYGILPLVSPDQLRLSISVFLERDYLVFHGFIAVKTFSFFGLERNTFESFHQRLRGLYGWFSAEFERRLSLGRSG